jgi:hypothetical protein
VGGLGSGNSEAKGAPVDGAAGSGIVGPPDASGGFRTPTGTAPMIPDALDRGEEYSGAVIPGLCGAS